MVMTLLERFRLLNWVCGGVHDGGERRERSPLEADKMVTLLSELLALIIMILCERGVRSFDPSTRYLLDLAAVPVLQQRTPLPVIVDPSHGTGNASYVAPMSKAALAVGADGLLIEVHANPDEALCDGQQALTPPRFAKLMAQLQKMAPLCDRQLSAPARVGGPGSASRSSSFDDEVIAP